MGNKQTKTATPDPPATTTEPYIPDDADEPSAGGLSWRDAWDIALTWREELRGCVRLETDVDECNFHVVDSFEWVTFVFDGSLEGGCKTVNNINDTTTAARAATVTWYALTCCTGYSGQENPRFWRRVFTELYYPKYPKSGIVWLKPQPDRPQRPITEATPFFPSTEKPFPRVRIVPKSGYESASLETFLLGPSSGNDAHSKELSRVLNRLKPYIRPNRWCQRPIPVAIEDVPASVLPNGLLNLKMFQSEAMKYLPDFRLSTVLLCAEGIHILLEAHEILHRSTATVVVPHCDATTLVRRSDRRVNLLLTDDNRPTRRFRIATMDFLWPVDENAEWYQAAVSALPYTQSVTALRFDFHRVVTTEHLRASDWAWLGYAVFHPDAERLSSFTALGIDLGGVPVEHIAMFAKMASGNNLPAESGASISTTNTTYELAKVRASTMVLSDPRDGADLLWTFPSEATVTLCVAGAGNQVSLGNWARAVIPGIGLGWIHSHSILEVSSRPAGLSCLRRLRLKIRSSADNDSTMLQLLTVIGENLRHLEIQDSKLMDTDRVLAVLRLCPSLTSLSIGHDGSCWSDAIALRQTPPLPRLQELELKLRDAGYNDRLALKELNAPQLDDLKAFRVVTPSHEAFSTNRKAFLATLARYPRLQYAHHTNGVEPKPSWEFQSYDERRTQMLALLGKIHRGVHDVSQGPITLNCSVAFLSVVQHAAMDGKSSALQRFGADIVRNILSFSTSPAPRDLYIDQSREHSRY